MGLTALNILSIKNKFKILKYSLGSKLINSVPKGLKHTYEFLNWLEFNSIHFHKENKLIQFNFPIENNDYLFSIDESSSDSDVFKQIIIEKEYEHVLDLINKNNITINSIVDAGANVGFTSIYISNYHPKSIILALEPNSKTFKRLNHNILINNIKNIITLEKGLWNKDTFLKADRSFRDKQDWSFRLEETLNVEEKLFETISIQNILTSQNWDTVDLLKIDIEGGEKELFNMDVDLNWLNKIKVIAIEIHDEFNCREDIENLLIKYGFELSYNGELTIGINREITPSQ